MSRQRKTREWFCILCSPWQPVAMHCMYLVCKDMQQSMQLCWDVTLPFLADLCYTVHTVGMLQTVHASFSQDVCFLFLDCWFAILTFHLLSLFCNTVVRQNEQKPHERWCFLSLTGIITSPCQNWDPCTPGWSLPLLPWSVSLTAMMGTLSLMIQKPSSITRYQPQCWLFG